MSHLSSLRTVSDPAVEAPRLPTPVAATGHTAAPAHAAPTRPANTASQPAHVAPVSEELNQLVREMQRKLESLSSDLQFSVDKDTGKNVVKVTDRTSKQVVWQFPSEDALQITRELDRYQKGLMLNRQA
ncbi:MAG: flagellar protein FlaG [Burkholderiales bacterium]|nr:flagellar protein FlaG [Burkholderiales bacterium]